jgi:hypothetical protein
LVPPVGVTVAEPFEERQAAGEDAGVTVKPDAAVIVAVPVIVPHKLFPTITE